MTESNWQSATADLTCPKCGAMNLPAALAAKPTLEQEQDGSYTCATCGTGFKAPTWQYLATKHQLESEKKDKDT